MLTRIDRRRILGMTSALGISLVLPSAHACEIVTTDFSIIHPWARATADDATTAIVCMGFENVTNTDRLIGADTPVASRSQMVAADGGPFEHFVIHAGQSSALSESGAHLRLVGLKFPLRVGRMYPMDLHFSKAGRVRASLNIDFVRFG